MITVEQVFQAYRALKEIEGLKASTLKSYEDHIRAVVAMDEPITALNPKRVQAKLLEARKKKRSDSHVLHLWGTAKRLSEFAVDQGYLEQLATTGIPRPKKPKKRRKPATHDDIMALIEAAKESKWPARDLAIILMLGAAGMRSGEVASLEIKNVDLENRWLYLQDTKNGEDRAVRIDSPTRDVLEEWLQVRPQCDNDHVIVSYSRRQPMKRYGINQIFRRLSRRTGEKVSAHTLRHFFATEWINNGGDALMLGAQIGHRDTRSTSIYVHQSQRGLANVFDALRGEENTMEAETPIGEAARAVLASLK